MSAAPAPMAASTANWHWKNKNVTRWGKEWFERELVTISVTDDKGQVVSISDVTDVAGDVELGQRKSKLITIYDSKISLKWTGTTLEGTEVNGALTIPEVSHEITLDGLSDYIYNWTLSTASTPEVDAVFALAKSRLPAALEAKFAEFPKALVETHGRDLTVSTQPSRAATPSSGNKDATIPATTFRQSADATKQFKPAPKDAVISTRTVEVEATFQASADDLFSLFTDEKRIPAWSRAPAQSTPKVEADYTLFNGNVKGRYISLTPGKQIIQSWTLQSPTWPEGHSATLTTTFEQSSDSTKVVFVMDGVPVGMKDEIKGNIERYYIHGLRSIGYVQLVPFDPAYPTPKSNRSEELPADLRGSGRYIIPIVIAGLVLAASLSIPYFFPSPVHSK